MHGSMSHRVLTASWRVAVASVAVTALTGAR